VTLSAGPIEGQASDRAAAWEWLGLPYAEAPVGDLRWKAPRPAVAWSEPLEAQTLPLECPQFDFFGAYVGAEDCLYLNVWRPQSQARDLPVLVWIHGGANRSGATNWPVYDGAKLAEAANIVVVTVQYRLGPLGWLYYPPLQDGNADDNSGNFGTLDIIATLEWVRDNIALFGGDAENVTAAGESAGGANVLSLMLAEKARGLFHKAIVQSAGGNVTSTAQAEQRVQALLDNLTGAEVERPAPVSDAERAQYLRDTSAEALVRNNPGTGAIYGDGHVLPVGGFDAFDSGDFPGKLPLLIGTNKDEYKLYTNPAGYNVLPNASAELRELVGRYVSDLWRVTGTDSIATTLRKLDDFPDIYAYRFNWGSPDEQGNSPLPPPFGPTAGAHHGAEIPFMFGNPDVFLIDAYQELLYTAQNEASRNTMASVMVDYWGSFIRQGDPNGGNQAAWSPWSNGEGAFKALVLDVNYSDDQPALSTDSEAWTLDSVFDDARSNVEEPLLSQLLPYMNGWIGD
tara:strand:- start:477559 stop:479094 length:1536 start_codon:yes stop_codon:yes gene_type:complete